MSRPRVDTDPDLGEVPVVTYSAESLAKSDADSTAEIMDVLGMYLLDLMKGHEYRVVSGVYFEIPEPEVCEYPKGWLVVRALVDVQEFDIDVDPDDAD